MDLSYQSAFVYFGPTDEVYFSDYLGTHYEIIEDQIEAAGYRLGQDFALGWLYDDHDDEGTIYVQWASVEYYPGSQEMQDKAVKALERQTEKHVRITEGQSQWDDGQTFAKVAYEQIPIEVVKIPPENLDFHGGGWPWVYQRSQNQIYIGDHQVYHFDMFESMIDSNEEIARQLATSYLRAGKDLSDFAIGRYDGYKNLGSFTYPAHSDEEDTSITIALSTVRNQLSSEGEPSAEEDSDYNDYSAKVAEVGENRALGRWPLGYAWLTSWIYLSDTDEVLMYEEGNSHSSIIERWEDQTRQDFDYDQPMELGVVLRDVREGYKTYQGNVIYPEYSDMFEERRELPVSQMHVLLKVRDKADELGYGVIGFLRGDDPHDGASMGEITRFSKFRAKKPRRHHVHKKEMYGFHRYDGYALFIPMWYPSIQSPPGGQIDTTGKLSADEQLQLPISIKFVSLPTAFLVGENTHHIYLLEAEYGADTFPSDTAAIGWAWLKDDVITNIGFDFGTPSGQTFAISQLKEWAAKEGYEVNLSQSEPKELANPY